MDDQENNGSSFDRPWESDEGLFDDEASTDEASTDESAEPAEAEETGEAVELPLLVEETASTDREPPSERADSGSEVDWDAMAAAGSDFDAFTSEGYASATTKEYQGLAEDVSRAAEEDWELQAVAATVPGVDTGLVGFEDVSGKASESEESYEAVEQAASSDLAMRVASALVILGLFLGSLILGGWWFTSFVILVMVVAVGELYATLRTRGYQPLALFGILGVIAMGIGAQNWGSAAIAGWALGITVLIILFFALTPRTRPLENASVTILGMAWVGVLSFAVLIAQGPNPVAYIFYIVALVALNDIGAYFTGRAAGRRKMAPVLSPNKTWEGFAGGLILTLVAAAVMATIPAWETISLTQGLITAAVVSFFGPLGDLVESMVKRSIDVKDMGAVLPGHGGILDRIDSFLFAVPAVYLLFRAFELL